MALPCTPPATGGRTRQERRTISTQGDDPGSFTAPTDLAAGRARLSGYRDLLRNRNYRLWFASGLGSSLGDWIGLFALQVLVVSLAEPGSRLALFGLGGIMMARLLPSAIFGPISGVVADRYDRKRLMLVADIARGGLFVVVAFSRDLVTLLALTFIIECLSLVYIAAKDASLPVIVERRHLTQANQLNLFVAYGPLPFGALAATALVQMAGLLATIGLTDLSPITVALLFNALTFFVAGGIITGLRLPAHGRRADPGEAPGVMEELREGLRFIRDLPLIRSLITGVVGVFFGAGVVVTLGPEFVRTGLGRPDTDWFGVVAAVGIGLLLGIVALPFVTNHVSRERLFPPCLAGTAATAALTALQPSFAVTLVLGFLLGGLAGMSFVSGYTLLHEYTRDDMRARTFAAFYTGTRVSMFAALAIAPFLAGAIGRFSIGGGGRVVTMSGVRITILAGGLVGLASAVSAWRGIYRSLRDDARGRGQALRLPLPASTEHAGLFVVFEGIEGSGKSTQVGRLADWLRGCGHEVVVTREPGGSPAAERIRAVVLDPAHDGMGPRTEALLYAAARADHVQRVIEPALRAGKTVLCDRFLDSSVVYQGAARGLGPEAVYDINRWATVGVTPDVVVLLELDVEEGLRRVAGRGQGLDRLESEQLVFHQRVADGYRALARSRGDRMVVVDAGGDVDAVAKRVLDAVRPWIERDASGPPTRSLHEDTAVQPREQAP